MHFHDVMFGVDDYWAKPRFWGEYEISKGAGCLPGRIVFRVSLIVKIIPVMVSCIHEVWTVFEFAAQ